MKINYEDKVALNSNPSIADINKVKADDMNEIKRVVNANEEDVGNLSDLKTADVTSLVNAINELAFDYIVDKGYDATTGWNYIKWNSGRCEAYATFSDTGIRCQAQAGPQYYGDAIPHELPSGLFTTVYDWSLTMGKGSHSSTFFPYGISTFNTTTISILYRSFSPNNSGNCGSFIYIWGLWK